MTNRVYEDEDLRDNYTRRRDTASVPEREISLGTPTILGMFFIFVLVLGGVFGLGYTLGRHSAEPPASLTDSTLAPGDGSPKPSAGTSGEPAIPTPLPDAPPPPAAETRTVPLTPTSAPAPAPSAPAAPASTPAAAPASAAASQPTASSSQTGAFYVQVAAVSSQDVADILTSSLQKKGYTVQVRPGTQDKLLHVQMGPYSDKKEAEAMRQRVLADGFNAIVK